MRADKRTAKVLERLCAAPETRLVEADGGSYHLAVSGRGRRMVIPEALVRELLASGLVQRSEPGRLAATEAATSWMARRGGGAESFREQHQTVETATIVEETGPVRVQINRDESPLGALARAGKSGKPWLGPEAVAAAERFRRDFERGQLQPRITANWSASVSDGRRGEGKGLADLTDMALQARLRFGEAVAAVGPELSGVLIDVCCLLKGLEAVERERAWPARSAKLVLRLARRRWRATMVLARKRSAGRRSVCGTGAKTTTAPASASPGGERRLGIDKNSGGERRLGVGAHTPDHGGQAV